MGQTALSVNQCRSIVSGLFADFFRSYEHWRGSASLLDISQEMTSQQYDILLKGVYADVQIPLWASVALDPQASLKDETTYAMICFCAGYGYEPEIMDGNPADYLGSQFAFLHYLYGCADQNPELISAASEFEERFTAATVRVFAEGYFAQEEVRCFEVEQLIHLMSDFLLGELPALCQGLLLEEKKAQVLRIERQKTIDVEKPHIIPSAGLNNCGGKCRIDITCAADCALQITTDCSDNLPQIRACVRGRGYRRTFLTPERIRYPMRRIGKRGEGKFERISWEEAAKEIAKRTTAIGQKYGPASRYFIYGTGNVSVMRADAMLKRLLNDDGGFLGYYNTYSNACGVYTTPFLYGDSFCGNSERDMLNSRLIILWGQNPSETIFGSWRNFYLAEAKAAGIPIIVIDPRQSDTALGLADEWIPIRPSTDGAMADAMAYEIITRNLQDQDFIDRFCLGYDDSQLPEGVPKGSGYADYLLGHQDGIPKTAEWASKICGVAPEVITSLAIRYATTKPAALFSGYGPQRTGNGEQWVRCMGALACLTGNVGIAGGSAGTPGKAPNRPLPAFPQGKPAYSGKIPTFLWTKAIESGTEMTKADGLEGVPHLDANIKEIFCIASNTLVNQHADIHRTTEILSDTSACEFIVVSDLFMTPSARFGDIVLPAVSLFENNNFTAPWFNDDYLLSNAKAVEPLFGAMPDYDWVRLVARAMGKEALMTDGGEDNDAWVRSLYAEYRERTGGLLPEYEVFREKGGYQYREAPVRIAYQEQIEQGVPFKTPSGKIELFSMRLYDMKQPDRIPAIPRYIPAIEGPEDALRSRYPLQLIGYHTKRRCHSIHDRNPWLEEVDPPALWIHPEDAALRGIQNGSVVEVYNDRGCIRIPAKVTRRIMQGVTALSQGGWYRPDANGVDTRGSINVLTDAAHPTPLAKANPQHTNLVEVRLASGSL